MRINRYCLLGLIFVQGCSSIGHHDGTAVVLEFIETRINNRKFDIRIFDPPPPPELQDSVKHNGRIRPDSIINKLVPLQVYINTSIAYDDVFKLKTRPIKGFEFIEDNNGKEKRLLEIDVLPKKNGIVLHGVTLEDFHRLHKSVNLQEGYGGFVSFRNLFYSKDGKRAYFEFTFYRRKLNSGTSAIYAQKKDDGTWEFESVLLSIS